MQLISDQLEAILTNMARSKPDIHAIILDYLAKCEWPCVFGFPKQQLPASFQTGQHTDTRLLCSLLTHAPYCRHTPPLTAAKDGGVPTSMLCGILDTMAPPAGQKPYDKLMALLTTGNGAHWVDG